MRNVPLGDLSLRPFHILDRQWAILVGGAKVPNPMTVSWGGMGTLWNRPVVTVYVRPTRYTYERLEEHREFTLNFLGPEGQQALEICGSTSGRDEDKWRLSGLTREASDCVEVPRVAEATLVFECRILSFADVDPSHFIDPTLNQLYPLADYHRIYFGEVLLAAERG